jgi:hypothetical protein
MVGNLLRESSVFVERLRAIGGSSTARTRRRDTLHCGRKLGRGPNLSVTRPGPAHPDCCYRIFEMRHGKALRITEYYDTILGESVLVHPRK